MELAECANLYSKQATKGGPLSGDRDKKLLKKETKRAGGETVLGELVPPKDQFHTLKRVLYPLLQAPRGTREKGQRGRTKARGHREGP